MLIPHGRGANFNLPPDGRAAATLVASAELYNAALLDFLHAPP